MGTLRTLPTFVSLHHSAHGLTTTCHQGWRYNRLCYQVCDLKQKFHTVTK